MKRSLLMIATLLLFGLGSCVTQQENIRMEEELAYYKRQALAGDSIKNVYQGLELENREEEDARRKLLMQLEQLTATNISLNKSYQEILAKYNELINQNNEVLAVSTYENQDLQERIAAQQMELDQRERELATMEYTLNEKGQMTAPSPYDNTGSNGVAQVDPRLQQLQGFVSGNQTKLEALRREMMQALTGFSSDEVSISESAGKLYVSMGDLLLFNGGNEEIDYRGNKALMQLAKVLNQHPDIDITVEGHTDNEGTAARNWDLSVLRATAVVRTLADYAVDPRRMTAAGKSFYHSVAINSSPNGKTLNRRTEIILSPKLDELYNMIKP